MADNKIPKEKLDDVLAVARHYYDLNTKAGDTDALTAMLASARDLEEEAEIGMHALLDVITGIVRYSGLKHDATNEDIYKVLEVLGWTVE